MTNIDADIESTDGITALSWDLPRDAETFLAVLTGSGATREQQRAAVADFLRLPVVEAMPEELKKELYERGLLANGRELRFGVRDGERHSQHWTLRAMAGRPDVYLASERTGRFFHVSFHDRTYGIRTEATTPGGERERVVPWPAPLVPGVRRIAQVLVPRGVVTYSTPIRSDVSWGPLPDDHKWWVSFDVLAEETGTVVNGPLVGRIAAVGGTVAVQARAVKGRDGNLSFTPVDGDHEVIREAVSSGHARALIVGDNPDGSVWFLELATEAATAKDSRPSALLADSHDPPEGS